MIVRLLADFADAYRARPRGSVLRLPDADARRLIALGLAEPGRADPIETATPVMAAEYAAKRGRRAGANQ